MKCWVRNTLSPFRQPGRETARPRSRRLAASLCLSELTFVHDKPPLCQSRVWRILSGSQSQEWDRDGPSHVINNCTAKILRVRLEIILAPPIVFT